MSRRPRYCSAPWCKNKTYENIPFFRFPKDKARCQSWILYVGRQDLLTKDTEVLYKTRLLCGVHFTRKQYVNDAKRRLIWNAVPDAYVEVMRDGDRQSSCFMASGNNCNQVNEWYRPQCEFTNQEELLLKKPCQQNRSYELCRNHCTEDRFTNISYNRLVPFVAPTLKGTSEKKADCDAVSTLLRNMIVIGRIPTNVFLKPSNNKKGCSIWSQEDITMGTRFGPFESQSSDKRKIVGEEKKTANDTYPFSWLNYINTAYNMKEQNLIRFVYRGEEYCMSIKDIPANTELLIASSIWFMFDLM